MGAIARREAKGRASFRTGLVAVLSLIGMVLFAITAQNGMPGYVPGAERNEIKAVFDDIGPLRAGDEVRIAGVRAGFVETIELKDGKPVVDMRLDGDRPVYRDARAALGARSALGQKYVDLSPGSTEAGQMPKGQTIPVEFTRSSTELDEVLDVFDEETREATRTTLRQVGGGVAGHGKDARDGLRASPDLLTDVQKISNALAADDGQDLVAMLEAAALLSGTLEGQSDDLAALTKDLATTVEAIAVDDGRPLQETIKQAPDTLATARSALEALEEPLRLTAEVTRTLRSAATDLGESTPDLRGFLVESVEPLQKVPSVAEPLKTAVIDLTPMVTEAKPLVGQAKVALDRAERPLGTLVPYLDDVMNFFTWAGSAMSSGDKNGRWLRLAPVITPEMAAGLIPTRTPTTKREAYPEPGAVLDHATKPLEVLK